MRERKINNGMAFGENEIHAQAFDNASYRNLQNHHAVYNVLLFWPFT
jgi:hypothetical protein